MAQAFVRAGMRLRPVRRAPGLYRARPRSIPGTRPIRSGRLFRWLWPVGHPIAVVDELAAQLNAVLEEFAQAAGATSEGPLKIVLRPGILGLHRTGRAVDIYGVGGKSIGRWANEWNAAQRKAAESKDPAEQTRIIDEEKARNLGYKLYKALQARGDWAQPQGYPVQLFGPWTRGEGPHKAISDRLLRAHRDHIHVAK